MKTLITILAIMALTGCMTVKQEDLISGPISFEFADDYYDLATKCRYKPGEVLACAYNTRRNCTIVLRREDWWLHVVHELEHCWQQRPDST